jgi:hypothetical protein
LERHILHKTVGKYLNSCEFEDVEKIIDPACGGNQNIPLFLTKQKSNETEICNVDFLLVQNNQIKVVIEIEEANVKPTQILGKLMTSVIARYYIHKNNNCKEIPMAEDVCFVQILDTSKLKPHSKKINQWTNIETEINRFLPKLNSNITSYKLFSGKHNEINLDEIYTYINSKLQNQTVA